jgi:hypothetical protein
MKKSLILAVVGLVYTSTNYGSAMEIEYQKSEVSLKNTNSVSVTKLKETIKSEIRALDEILNKDFQEKAIEQGWLDLKVPEKGTLFQLYNDINPCKKQVLSAISQYFRKIIKNPEISDLALSIKDNVESLPSQMLESKISEYFVNLYNPESITFFNKKGGVQLGKIVDIKIGKDTLRYYVKTHAKGLLQETKNSTNKPVDPIELFTYKLLEMSGYGSESHFFYDDECNFYIATKDIVSYSDNPNDPYFSKKYEDLLEKDHEGFKVGFKETYKKYSLESEQNFINGLMTADILSRTMCLTDVLTNDGNIMFLIIKGEWKLKVIDFRNWAADINLISGRSLYGGLFAGNGQFNYIGQKDKIISHYLGKEGLESRIQRAKGFDYKNLLMAVDSAEKEIKIYMELKENIDLFKDRRDKIYNYANQLKLIITEFAETAQFPEKIKQIFDENKLKIAKLEY